MAGAVVTALVGAVITTQNVTAAAQFLWPFDDQAPASTAAPTLKLKLVSRSDGAVAVKVPDDWAVGDSPFNVAYGGMVSPGAAIRASASLGSSSETEPSIYVGASTATASRLLLEGRSEADLMQWATESVRHLDWSLSQCAFVREEPLDVQAMVGTYRLWRDCRTVEGVRLWELAAATADGSVAITLQLSLRGDVNDDTAKAMLESVTVRPELLPRGPARPITKGEMGGPEPPFGVAPATGDFILP